MAENPRRGKRPAKSFRQLVVWQEANALAKRAARVCGQLPRRHAWLADQLLRASASVPFNISEGNGAPTRPEYLRYLGIARRSLNEVEGQVEYMRDTPLATPADFQAMRLHIVRTGRLLAALIKSLEA